ncbi:erythromycin esterase family protein [Nocardia sp. NPDC020380]|uniref:erythromycin esterase family protein n=1 Tax=Nocardia sp. NPDC020380 TaxID=3364309 RepID=UPI0037A0A006
MSEMTDTAAHPIARLLADHGPVPFDAAALRELAASLAPATVVGLGESTRFSHEIAAIQDQLFRELVSEHGFRVLALQDSADVAARLDAYVRAAEHAPATAEEALATAWRPNRTAQTAAVLDWIRDFNRRNETDRIRVIAVKPFQATTADYDAVLDAMRAATHDPAAFEASPADLGTRVTEVTGRDLVPGPATGPSEPESRDTPAGSGAATGLRAPAGSGVPTGLGDPPEGAEAAGPAATEGQDTSSGWPAIAASSAADRMTRIAALFEVIRTAHVTDEHVQRARGMYSGAPFAELARGAAALLDGLPISGDIRERMALIVRYHETSVAGRGSFAGEAEVWAGAIIEDHARHGQRIVYWDGIAHVSAAPFTLGMSGDQVAQPTIGSVLRERFGAGYASVAIGFDHGDLGVVVVPPAAGDFLDHELSLADALVHWVDLRPEPVRAALRVPAKMRVIAGVYDPARDESAYMTVDSLSDSFDALVHVRSVSAVDWLA